MPAAKFNLGTFSSAVAGTPVFVGDWAVGYGSRGIIQTGTATLTWQLQGSVDASTWVNVPINYGQSAQNYNQFTSTAEAGADNELVTIFGAYVPWYRINVSAYTSGNMSFILVGAI